MLPLTFFFLTVAPIVAHGLPSSVGKCKARTVTVNVTHTVTLDPTTVLAPTEVPSAPPSPTKSPVPSSLPPYEPTGAAPPPGTTTAAAEPTSVGSSSTQAKTTMTTAIVKEKPKEEEPSATATATATAGDAAAYADATELADGPAATQMCGDSDRKIMPGYPWTVSNAMYNAGRMEGRQCTNYEAVLAAADGTRLVRYTSVSGVRRVDDTEDVCKGYSNVGIGKNLRKRFADVKAIPAYFQWERTNTTEFKGANVFDFITAPTSGDSGSTDTAEFMLWLQIWGGQVPIGYSRGPVATFDLYGTTFRLYEGENPGSGVTVRSALPERPFGDRDGVFRGDLREWLQVMADRGHVRDGDFVNVGNAGTEVFYGDSEMSAVVALEIEA